MGGEHTVVDLIFCLYEALIDHSCANYSRVWVKNNYQPCITTNHVEVFLKTVYVQFFSPIQSLNQLFLLGIAGMNLIVVLVEFPRFYGQAIAG